MFAVVLTIVALILWIISVLTTSVANNELSGTIGLFSVLPVSYFVSLSLLVLSFFLELRSGALNQRMLFSQTIILVVILCGTTALLEGSARFTSSYINYQSVDYISQVGHVDSSTQWIHNWPGFSILYSVLAQTAALPAQMLLEVYPTFINALIFFPLLIFFRFVIDDKRLAWLSIWVFYFANWIGQDYFSMQSFGFFAFVAFFAIMYKFAGLSSVSDRRWRVVLIILFSAAVVSHSLTSIALLSLVMVYFVARIFRPLLRPRFLAILALILVGWSVFGAHTYLEWNLQSFITQAFDINSILQSNIAGRLAGSTEHIIAANIRLILSFSFILFATLGLVVLWKMNNRRGKNVGFDKPILLALLSTIILGGSFSYGGELFMRLYLFSLIPMVYLISRGVGNKTIFVVLAVFLIVVAPTLHMVARYGNEVMDYVPLSEIKGGDFFYTKTTQGYVIGMFRDTTYHDSYEYCYYDESFKYFPYADAKWEGGRFSLGGLESEHADWLRFVCISYGDRALHDLLLQPQFFTDTIRNVSQSVYYDGIYSNPSFEVYYEVRT